MQRKANESFTAYQSRRAAASRAVKLLNAEAKGGKSTSRETQRAARNNSKHAGAFGRSIRSQMAERRATPARLSRHIDHVMHLAQRSASRLLAV